MELVHKEFGKMWVELKPDGTVWFSANEVCDMLGYSNGRDALKKHVPPIHKGVAKRDTLGGIQEISVIDESGLYRLILRSRMPQAEPFMNWVTEDVIPTIRKTGKYDHAENQGKKQNYKQQLKSLLRTMRDTLTYTDEQVIARKLGCDTTRIAHTLVGRNEDVTIMHELYQRTLQNRAMRKLYYTTEGIEQLKALLETDKLKVKS